MTVLPYVQGVTERVQRAMKKHGIVTPVRPHTTLRKILVHPKDKVPDDQKCGIVYRIPCLSCPMLYTGESARKLTTRIEEHKAEVEVKTSLPKTRSTSVTEDTSQFKSATTEHARENNHVLDWESVSILERESHNMKRWIREAIQERKLEEGVSMNRNIGKYTLDHVWDTILRPPRQPPQRDRHHQS